MSDMEMPLSHFSAQRRLWCALVLSVIYIALLFAGSLLSGSLTLAADSAHMLGHGVALGIALCASVLARRLSRKSYSLGYKHVEAIGGYTNGLLLLGISLGIAWEAAGRLWWTGESESHLHHAHGIDTGIMGAVALAGLLLHGVSAWILHGGRRESLNVHALYLHIFFDLAATLTGLVTSVVIHFTGFEALDSLAGLAIAAFIFISAGRIVRRSVRLIVESLPDDLDPERIRHAILALPHVESVHNMIFRPGEKSGELSMSAHIVLDPCCVDTRHWEECRKSIEALLKTHSIGTSVLQLESARAHAHDRHEH